MAYTKFSSDIKIDTSINLTDIDPASETFNGTDEEDLIKLANKLQDHICNDACYKSNKDKE